MVGRTGDTDHPGQACLAGLTEGMRMELETKVIENEQRSKSNVHRLDRL